MMLVLLYHGKHCAVAVRVSVRPPKRQIGVGLVCVQHVPARMQSAMSRAMPTSRGWYPGALTHAWSLAAVHIRRRNIRHYTALPLCTLPVTGKPSHCGAGEAALGGHLRSAAHALRCMALEVSGAGRRYGLDRPLTGRPGYRQSVAHT